MKVRFWTKVKVEFWPNLGPNQKAILVQNPTFSLLTFFGNQTRKKPSTPCVWLKRQHQKSVQDLTFKTAKLGPEPNLTAYMARASLNTYLCVF